MIFDVKMEFAIPKVDHPSLILHLVLLSLDNDVEIRLCKYSYCVAFWSVAFSVLISVSAFIYCLPLPGSF